MKHLLLLALCAPLLMAQPEPTPGPAAAAMALIRRVLPEQAARFRCEVIPADAGQDVFEIDSADGHIVLRGNQGISLAMAFNWYLRRECRVNYDWEARAPLQLASQAPLPEAKLRRTCAAPERFALNYCTYGYTFPFWQWDQWQRFVDWMAMNGINRPLLQCGQEATWLKVWQSYGIPQAQVQEFFAGPAHLPWQRMANLDSWGGPLPLSYIDGQRQLQIEILARARSLGMQPILGAFAGHVPKQLKAVRPEAKITRIKPGWGGMAEQYATWFLDPTDPLFPDIQQRFLKEQTAMFGTDHLYSADPFNEIAPPSWEPEYLAKVSSTIYQSMRGGDPAAIWYLMSWNFFFDENWTPPRLKALTLAVPTGKLIYLDYVCEQAEFFRKTDNFHGAPFVWCVVGNFGGTTNFAAPLKVISGRLAAALPVANCRGLGTTLEGLNSNPVAFDLLFEQAWHPGATVELNTWLEAYADRRAGRTDRSVRDAWRILQAEIFTDDPEGLWGRQNLLQTVPNLGDGGRKLFVPARQAALVAAIDALLAAAPACRQADGYQYDLVNLTRQALGNATYIIGKRLLAAASRKELPAFRREAARLMDLGEDLDALLGTRHEWLLGRWLADARAWAASAAEADYYERNAREIITTWHEPGGGLSDYARRQWNGLFRSYYMGRWREFIQRVDQALEAGTPFDASSYQKARVAADGRWVTSTQRGFLIHPQGDPCETAARLMAKYRPDLVVPAPEVLPVSKVALATPAWSPAAFTGEGRHCWTLDASALVRSTGTHLVTFRFREGDSALTIQQVALVQDGRELAADTHDGWAGNEHKNHTYRLTVKELAPGKPVTLVIGVEPASSIQTTGVIEIRREDDLPPPP
ncbi:MAG: alpha-N-acetylglucosaminidase [Verrucomicrobia bacterium]|nr:alpha-N-acetylglucosaminidase [Verrucomicrobiota bacterium]